MPDVTQDLGHSDLRAVFEDILLKARDVCEFAQPFQWVRSRQSLDKVNKLSQRLVRHHALLCSQHRNFRPTFHLVGSSRSLSNQPLASVSPSNKCFGVAGGATTGTNIGPRAGATVGSDASKRSPFSRFVVIAFAPSKMHRRTHFYVFFEPSSVMGGAPCSFRPTSWPLASLPSLPGAGWSSSLRDCCSR